MKDNFAHKSLPALELQPEYTFLDLPQFQHSEMLNCVEKLLDNRLGVIHVGASAAEERDWYYTKGFEPIYWIEADPNKVFTIQDNIREYENQYCINAAISDKEEEVNFYIT